MLVKLQLFKIKTQRMKYFKKKKIKVNSLLKKIKVNKFLINKENLRHILISIFLKI